MGQDLTVDKFDLIPGRIDAAMRFVEHCRLITEAIHCCGGSTQGRDLCASERATYEAALGAMRLYFAGEMDYGGAPVRLPDPPVEAAQGEKPAKDGKLCKSCRKARRDSSDE